MWSFNCCKNKTMDVSYWLLKDLCQSQGGFWNHFSQQKRSHNMKGHKKLDQNVIWFLVYPFAWGHLANWKGESEMAPNISLLVPHLLWPALPLPPPPPELLGVSEDPPPPLNPFAFQLFLLGLDVISPNGVDEASLQTSLRSVTDEPLWRLLLPPELFPSRETFSAVPRREQLLCNLTQLLVK